ncbi:MAG: type III-B CRISPR module-associated protein Cmr5 [Anaerolineaceae bacterium]
MVMPIPTQQSNQRTLEQKRAEAAWTCIQTLTKWTDDEKKKFRSLARGSASDIQINGLGQTAAFWKAKGGKENCTLLSSLASWLNSQLQLNLTNDNDLLAWIRHPDTTSDDYRRATAEAIAFLIWVKRFAEAELPKE